MRKTNVLLPLALLTLAAFPAAAQEMPRVLFCMGQCLGIDEAGNRVPVTKGTRLAPGLRLETGPDSYAQVKIGSDTAFGIGESARVRFDRRDLDRDVVILDQGRIRMVGGEAIGRPATRPVELHTTEGNFVLRSADIEVKTLPAQTLVKLNVGEARLGDLPVTTDAVQGVVGGKILDRVIPIGDIALATPRRDPAPAGPGGVSGQSVRPPLIALPVINLPATEPRPFPTPITISPAIVSPELVRSTLPVLTTTFVSRTAIAPQPIVPAGDIVLTKPITTSTGTTTLNTIATNIQTSNTTTATQSTTQSTTQTTTLMAPLTTTLTLQQSTLTKTSNTSTLTVR